MLVIKQEKMNSVYGKLNPRPHACYHGFNSDINGCKTEGEENGETSGAGALSSSRTCG